MFIDFLEKLKMKRMLTISEVWWWGEFENLGFQDFYRINGYAHEFFSPRTPQQIDIVDRKNHVLQEASCLC